MCLNTFTSVIVPVYNAEKYLCRCIDSLLTQTYENIEIILVDDGSEDKSPEICDEYAGKHSKIKVIHQANAGQSSARNAGLSAASGGLVMFVDSDDWIEPEMIAHLLEFKEKNNVDLVICSYCREYDSNSFPVHIFSGDMIFHGNEYFDKIYRRLYGPVKGELRYPEKLDSLGSACMKLYPRKIFLHADFIDTKEVGSAEDVLLNMSILKYLKSAAYIDRPYYHYRKGSGSTAKYRPALAEQWETLYRYMNSYLDRFSLDSQYKQALLNRRAIGILGLGLNECGSQDSVYAKSRRIDRILNQPEYRKAFSALQMKYFPLKWKVFFFCAKYNFSLIFVIMLSLISKLRKRIVG